MNTSSARTQLSAYTELTKPRILCLVLVTTLLGYFLGARGMRSGWEALITLAGTALSCAGAGVLNNYLEREADAKMRRTQRRPIPSGTVAPSDALMFGLLLVLAGVTMLVTFINLMCGFLALLTVFMYVLVYTPLKRITWLNTLVGAIPGALPPLGGWVAGSGKLELGGWILFAILFIWQQPHFYAIAWMYKDDYARGGFQMLPVIDASGKRTFRQVVLFSLLLIPVSLSPYYLGMSGLVYFIGALVSGVAFLAVGISAASTRSMIDARRLLRASIIYLPVVFALFLGDCRF